MADAGVEQFEKRRIAAMHYLAVGWSRTKAARMAGMDVRQVNEMWADPSDRAEIDRLHDEIVGDVGRRLSVVINESVTVLRRLMHTGTPAIRLNAARALGEMAMKYRSIDAIERRLDQLEAEIEQGNKPIEVTAKLTGATDDGPCTCPADEEFL